MSSNTENQPTTIIFDLGGVLINWDPRTLYRKIFDTEEEIDWFLSNVCTMAWNEEQDAGRTWLEATAVKIQEFPAYAEHIKAYSSRWAEMLGGPVDGTVSILKKLRKNPNYKIYALTNWSAETFPIALERYDFLKLFDGIVVSGIEKVRKPFPEIFQLILSRYNIEASKALFIDDNMLNIAAAQNQGIDTIHFSSLGDLQQELDNRHIT